MIHLIISMITILKKILKHKLEIFGSMLLSEIHIVISLKLSINIRLIFVIKRILIKLLNFK